MKTVNRTKLTSDWLQSQKEKDIKQERIMSRHALDGKFGSAIKKLKIMDSKKIKKMIKEDKDGVFARLSKK